MEDNEINYFSFSNAVISFFPNRNLQPKILFAAKGDGSSFVFELLQFKINNGN